MYVNSRSERLDPNDCTVVSLSVVLGIPYAEAYKIMQDAGRKPGKGIPMCSVLSSARFQKKFERINLPKKITVHKFAQQFNTGRYIVLTSGHAQCVIEGIIHDNLNFGPMRRVQFAFRVKDTED